MSQAAEQFSDPFPTRVPEKRDFIPRYAAPGPRPEYLGAREDIQPLTMQDDFPELAGQGVAPLG